MRYDLFGTGGGRREAERLEVPLLAEVPLEIATRKAGDNGTPIVLLVPDSLSARAFTHAAERLSLGALKK